MVSWNMTYWRDENVFEEAFFAFGDIGKPAGFAISNWSIN